MIKEDYADFTEERYETLKNRIIQIQERNFRLQFDKSRKKEASINFISGINAVYLSFISEETFLNALESFNRSFELWFSVPEIMKSLEPNLEILQRQYDESNVIPSKSHSKKVKKRFRLFGFIPTRPIITEYYDEDSKLLKTVYENYNLSIKQLIRLGKANSQDEKDAVMNDIYSVRIEPASKPLKISIYNGKPTMLKLFHAIVKYNAILEFLELVKQEKISGVEIQDDQKEMIVNEISQSEQLLSSRKERPKSPRRKVSAFRKKQAFVLFFLLEAMELSPSNSKANTIRLLEILSGNEGSINPDSSQFKKLLNHICPESYKADEVKEVIDLFLGLDVTKKNAILQKAIQKIDKDMSST